jgi:NAD(P)H-dependent glutamate synthase small subunit
MGELRGFLKYNRQNVGHRPIAERIKDFAEIDLPLTPDDLRQQAARCMNCGIPFCHGAGCPVDNLIPDFNDLVYHHRWEQACRVLHSTNNFPEFTGRVCPAPCEAACTLAVNDDPVLIRHIELQIVERGFKEGWIRPQPAVTKSGKRVAVIGSGPTGLAAAQQLARQGHGVLVIEQDEQPGGMLRYGIPDFKLEKWVIDRRLEQMRQEGVEFQTGVTAGEDVSARYLRRRFDGVLLAMGSRQPRDLDVPGRDFDNVLFAMDYLTGQNKINAGQDLDRTKILSTKDKDVVVIGGGDTGSDCVGTARRQGARTIHQLEILPKPPETRPSDTPWPTWPRIMRTSSSHEEGCERRWSVQTQRFGGTEVRVSELHGIEVEWIKGPRGWQTRELPGTEFVLKADLVLLAMGFVHVVHAGLVENLGLRLDDRGNILVNNYQTSAPWVFAAGDTITGASLVVRAIASGRQAAAAMDRWLRC